MGFHEFEMFGDKSLYFHSIRCAGASISYQVLAEVILKSTGASRSQQLSLHHKQENPNADIT